jgi:TonB family protein
MSKLPPELRYDTAPKLRGSARPVYPYAALVAKRDGRASVKYLVDERGRVIDAAVMEASSPEFGHALLVAIEQFEYEPALKSGQPCKALLAFSQEFKRESIYQLVSDIDLDLIRREEKRPASIGTLRDIDGKLKSLSQRPPTIPLSLKSTTGKAEALIEFLVDEEGRARLPRVMSASHEAFGYAAVQGVAAWRFEAPTRGGRATITRVQVPIQAVP